MLQWSHGILAMDSRIRNHDISTPETLQWSHGILAMDSLSQVS